MLRNTRLTYLRLFNNLIDSHFSDLSSSNIIKRTLLERPCIKCALTQYHAFNHLILPKTNINNILPFDNMLFNPFYNVN